MALDQLARVSRVADRAVSVALTGSPHRQRYALAGMVLLVAVHYRRPRRAELELVA